MSELNKDEIRQSAGTQIDGDEEALESSGKDETKKNTSKLEKDDPPTGHTEDQIAAMLEKARSDEKKKIYSKLEESQKAKDALAEQKAKLEAELEAAQDTLGKVREGKMSELKSVNEEIAALRDQNSKLSQAVDNVATIAAEKLAASELNMYRETKIREAALGLPELVIGETREDIDASIAKAQERERTMKETLRESVRKEIAADLPSPLAPDGSQGRGPSEGMDTQNRVAVASLRGEEYNKARAAILEEAKTKAGL